MNSQTQTKVDTSESSFPVGLVMVPMVLGSLVWMCVLVSRSLGF